jgi:hypothetical protein
MKRAFFKVFVLGVLVTFFLINFCWAWDLRGKYVPKFVKGIEFFSGFVQSKLREKGNYRLTPLIVDFDIDLKPLVKKVGFMPRNMVQFQWEPFISPVYEPNGNIEVGNAFLLKIGLLPEGKKIQPFVLLGPGFVFMSQHTREQNSQFNFVEYAGLGAHYFIKKNLAFTVEYRFRHLSNAGLHHPNRGIESHFALVGISYQF